MESPRWNVVAPSQFEWERRGLEFVRTRLPDAEPYRAWANFEFQTQDGAIYEVDLLVLTPAGFWFVEIKSWPGRVSGDVAVWTRSFEGRSRSLDNPLNLANRKAKALSSLLKNQPALGHGKPALPWLDAVVFLSAEGLQCDLVGPARNRILLQDRPADEKRSERKGIIAALCRREGPGIDPNPRGKIDKPLAHALTRAMEQAGIRPSQSSRRVGDYILGELLGEGPGYQDRLGSHAVLKDVVCRIRQYHVGHAVSDEDRARLRRAAEREFRIIQNLDHEGVLPVLDYREHELGPALLFKHSAAGSVRLDHFLATHGEVLSTDQRLAMLRQAADAIRYAHRKRIVHRALSPQSILVVDPAAAVPKLQVYNWQVGVRESASTSGRMTEVDAWVEAQVLVYMAPETISGVRQTSEAADVFSLGALAFHLFALRPPAADVTELAKILRERKGLSLAAVLDGTGPKLEDLVHLSTHPDVMTRLASVDDFLELLDDVEEELTAPPAEEVVSDPRQAKRGERLPHGYFLERVLGQGATAVALLVQKDEKEYVLKVALSNDHDARLHEEAKVLRTLHSEFIVRLVDEVEMGGRTVLVLQKAGDETLAGLLRREGALSLEMLARYGDDLLAALESLERHGAVHRDVKPDNIGVRTPTKGRCQLVLFDFSLGMAPLEHIQVGTEGYRDPFLKNRKPPRWDLAAERYAAAVTMYEMTLGAGVLPQWGEGKSDPALTDDELVLEVEKFDASVRDGMAAFFQRALHREASSRFDNAEKMRKAWAKVFDDADRPTVKTPHGEVPLAVSLEATDLKTPISVLDLSTRARNVLERADVLAVRDLLAFPPGDLHVMRGVGDRTRKEIVDFVVKLRDRFPDFVANARPKTDESGGEAPETLGPPGLEVLANRIMGGRHLRQDREGEWNIRAALLGVSQGAGTESASAAAWPSQSDVAEALDMTRARVGQVVSNDRARWSKDPLLTAFRHEFCEQLLRLGGVVSIAEAVDLVLLLRPATQTAEPKERRRLAAAVARAAVETETGYATARFQLRRALGVPTVACSAELALYAVKLGQAADALASADPLPSPLRVFQALFEVPLPGLPDNCLQPSNDRLLRLAASTSSKAAVSSRQELYPRGMPAERALRLGAGAVVGTAAGEGDDPGFTPEELRKRLENRYPEAEPLPDRPELDHLLERVGLEVYWNADAGKFQRKDLRAQVTSGSSIPPRRTTAIVFRGQEVSDEVAEARQFEERLRFAFRDGGFLVVAVRPSRMRRCESELLRRFSLERLSFDTLFLDALRREAAEWEVDWSVIEAADSAPPDSPDWRNLLHLAAKAGDRITADLVARTSPVLVVHPGFIARYDLMGVLEKLRDAAGRPGCCPAVWVLVATDGSQEMPHLDGTAIPLVTPGERVKASDPWIDNLHRSRHDLPDDSTRDRRDSPESIA